MRVNATSSIWNMRKNWQAKGWGRIEKSLPKNVGSSWAAMFASNSERSCRKMKKNWKNHAHTWIRQQSAGALLLLQIEKLTAYRVIDSFIAFWLIFAVCTQTHPQRALAYFSECFSNICVLVLAVARTHARLVYTLKNWVALKFQLK